MPLNTNTPATASRLSVKSHRAAATGPGEGFASLADAFQARRLAGGLKQVLVRFAAGGAVGATSTAS